MPVIARCHQVCSHDEIGQFIQLIQFRFERFGFFPGVPNLLAGQSPKRFVDLRKTLADLAACDVNPPWLTVNAFRSVIVTAFVDSHRCTTLAPYAPLSGLTIDGNIGKCGFGRRIPLI